MRTISESPVDFVLVTRKKESENDKRKSSGFCVSYKQEIKSKRLAKVQWLLCLLRAKNNVRTIREIPVDFP